MGNSDARDRLPAPSSSDELSSILRQVLSRTPPTAQPSFSRKKIVSSGEMFNRTFPLVHGGAVSYAACAVSETEEGKCAFENQTDKASMFDETIEYLKQLQLQFSTLGFGQAH
ncbi:hypothetical protein YC2023_050128 [Brassica napus]